MTNVDTAVSPPRRRKRGPKGPRHVFDRRKGVGHRAHVLERVFQARLPEAAKDPVLLAAIRRAAELTAISEHMRARMVRGEDVNPDDVLRMSRTSDLLTRRLHLDRHKPAPMTPTLFEYLGRNANSGGGG